MTILAADLASYLGGDAPPVNERYARFFLGSGSAVVQIELLEINHPFFTKTYRLVRNVTSGITVTLEDGTTQATFDYLPLRIENLGARDTLDYGIRVDLGDLGELLPLELDSLAAHELTPWAFWYASTDALAAILSSLSDLVNVNLPVGNGIPVVALFGLGVPDGLSVDIQTVWVVGAVTGYLVTASPTPPDVADPGWLGTPPTSYFFGTDGTFTLYAWAKNANGVSAGQPSTPIVIDAWYGTADALATILSTLSTVVNTDLPG